MKEKNIVHRDLKPDNILIKYVTEDKKNYIAKICDYGISKLEKYTKLKTHIGTHLYMAPEIIETIGKKKLKTTGDKDLDDLINKLLIIHFYSLKLKMAMN